MGEMNKVIRVEEYLNVKKKALDLGCNVPNSIAILPRNFEGARSKEDLLHESETPTVRTLWRQKGITETPLEKKGEKIPFVIEESFAWLLPIIFFASSFISQNPQLIDTAIGVISNYLTDLFKGIPDSKKRVRLNVAVETKSGTFKKISYEGPPEGLNSLAEIIREVHDGR